jgi:hypothetical protein
MKLKSPALMILLFIFLSGWGFSVFAGQITITVPGSSRITAGNQILQSVNLNLSNAVAKDISSMNQIINNVENIISKERNARYILKPSLLTRGNLYILAGSVVGSVLFDKMIDYLENQKNHYSNIFPPAGCVYLWTNGRCPPVYRDVTVCNKPDNPPAYWGYLEATITGWNIRGGGYCEPIISFSQSTIPKDQCVSLRVDTGFDPNGINFKEGEAPDNFLPIKSCDPNQPDTDNRKPITIIPIPPDIVSQNVPNSDLTTSIPFSDSPDIKTPQDIQPPLVSPDGSTSFDLPNVSPDGIVSSDPTMPGNDVPDIPAPFQTKISYNINNTTNNTTNNYNEVVNNTNNNTNNNNDSFAPTDADLDTHLDIPEKKDIKSLIMSNIETLKAKFNFDNSCSGGSCSFSIDVFGSSAVVDFCQFEGIFSVIGSVILVFSYFYAFFIVARGD